MKFLSFSLLMLCCASVFAQKRISLNSDAGTQWMLRPQSEVGKDSVQMYSANYPVNGWVKAVVPGAVFTSYVEAGLEKDPNFGDNIYKVDKSKYNRNFWYRAVFATPQVSKENKVWLNFEGINRKGEIFFNRVSLGLLDGFMHRGKFDVTSLLVANGKNVVAVLVHWPTLPVPNHASPTYISSDGWDWMPSVPGLLNGITDDIYLSISNAVTISDPWIRTNVNEEKQASVSVQMDVKNNADEMQDGIVTGVINPGNIKFSEKVKLQAGQSRSIYFDSARIKQLFIKDPQLWWPNGYGDANLYTCTLQYSVNGNVSDEKQIRFGIKKYSYDTTGGVLHISVNGQRIFVKGGNWGMSEYLLRCRGEEYDLKVKLHKEMNYNMIRNWIGSTTDDEFYEACDKYGIMVWDDFWLNSHPNLPDDVFAFNMNAVEKIKRLRNHPSIAVWCGDNEGYPLPPLNGWLREDVKTFDAGDRLYQPNSHSDALTGSGPWANFHPNWYFTKYPGGFGGDPGWGFRTEIGTAVFTTFESFKKFMPDSSWWPRNEMWNKHFFGPSAANGGPDHYFSTVNTSYGEAKGIEDFCRKSQLVNLETNKALYEGWQHHMWNDASGVMTWMSQSAYPSFVWQTYDYYYDLNGAYWGVKKACEPLHIQWSYADNSIKVINTTLQNANNLKAKATIYNLDGKEVAQYTKDVTVNAPANAATDAFRINFTTDNLAFEKIAVASSASKDAGDANAATDGSSGSRWSSNYNDDEWIYVDLGESKEISTVIINWESAHAKAFRLQLSEDLNTWKDVYETSDGKGGMEHINFTPTKARYVKMQGIKRASQWGYSIFEMEVYGKKKSVSGLTDVHFIKLQLTDAKGKLVSDNFYWRSNKSADYTALNSMPKAKLQTSSKLSTKEGKSTITATITNSNKSVAFVVHVQAVRASDGERILPAMMTDNYFSLLKGESKTVEITFDSALLKDGKYKLTVEPYNK